MFTLGLDRDGTQVWAHQFGGPHNEHLRLDGDVHAADGQGNHYIVGHTGSSTDSWDIGNCANCAGGDVVIVKYISAGQQLWIKRHGSDQIDY